MASGRPLSAYVGSVHSGSAVGCEAESSGHDLQQPGAVIPPAGICAGGSGLPESLPRLKQSHNTRTDGPAAGRRIWGSNKHNYNFEGPHL